jgi:hypothetical protein
VLTSWWIINLWFSQVFVELLEAILDIIEVVYGNQVLIEVNKTLTQSVVSRVLTAVHVQPITLN